MRPDRATRGFLVLLAVAVLVGAIVFCGALGGVLVPLLLSRLSGGGLGALADTAVLPAFVLLSLVVACVSLADANKTRCQLVSSPSEPGLVLRFATSKRSSTTADNALSGGVTLRACAHQLDGDLGRSCSRRAERRS